MGRKKPVSGKARKEQLVAKRQTKRETFVATPHPLDADVHGLPLNSAAVIRTASRPSGAQRFRTPEEAARADKGAQRMKMESRFLKLPLDLLQHHRLVSATEVLGRPIRQEFGVLHVEELQPPELEELPRLTCPARPKWRYTQSKEEVEKNEEGMFKKWIATTDGLFNEFADKMPGGPLRTSPSFFERNLQVWRQLWRVTETASILLILIDVRFPLIHYPPALEAYVKGLKDKKVILVLTKTDLVPRWLSEAWKTWFEEREGPEGASVVLMESYREVDKTDLTQGTQARFTPAAPPQARLSLLDALRKAHNELLQPPPSVSENPERLARWSPKHRHEVDWESVEDEAAIKKADEAAAAAASAAGAAKVGTEVPKKEKKGRRNKKKDEYIPRAPKPAPGQKVAIEEPEPEPEPEPEAEPERPWEELEGDDAYPFISVGLIGQPNVGKSSLLNALLGRKVVRASRTPGKTKTLQTIFWNRTIRLVDCPGLVCPSFAGMERQVLSGIIPIQNVEPVLYFIAQRMPFEKILKLTHPELDEYSFDDPPGWTADDLLAEYATMQGFITAKAGRPDLYRAGAFILRQLHSSSIPWGFRPPFEGDASEQGQQEGIWIKDFRARASNAEALKREREYVGGGESEEESEEGDREGEGEGSEEGSEEETESEEDKKAVAAVRGAFAALMVEGDDDSDDEESEEDE